MNTSYNKNRIVDDGWKTVLLNSIIDPININIPRTLTQFLGAKKEPVNNNHTLHLQNRSNPDQHPSSPSPDNHVQNSSLFQKTREENASKIFIIAKHELDIDLVDIEHDATLSEEESVPSTSKEDKQNQNNGQGVLHSQKSKTDSDDEKVSFCCASTKIYRLSMGEEMLSNMLKHLNDENSYRHYFNQLIEFEDSLKNKDIAHIPKFEMDPFKMTDKTSRSCRNRKSNGQEQSNSLSNKITIQHLNTNLTKNKISKVEATNINDVVAVLLRAQLRRDMLKHFRVYCRNEDRYNDFLQSLFEFEEMLNRK